MGRCLATIGKKLRKRIAIRSRHRCGYCLAKSKCVNQRLQLDHIFPKSRGGATEEANLCLACAACNLFKGKQTHALDPKSGLRIRLFNPSTQNWFEHFSWSKDGLRIIGMTPCGCATVSALRLNNPLAVRVRRVWVKAKEHPPLK